MAQSRTVTMRLLRQGGLFLLASFVAQRLRSSVEFLKALWRLGGNASLDSLADLVLDAPSGIARPVFAMQKRAEILPALQRIADRRPKVVVEIGTAAGGNLLLLARAAAPNALIISIDLPNGPFGGGYGLWRTGLYKLFAKRSQRIRLIRKDSHRASTRRHA
jgi:hypothetical protein